MRVRGRRYRRNEKSSTPFDGAQGKAFSQLEREMGTPG